MKIAVIGCTHAGTAAVKTIAAEHPQADITVYERNDNISFLSCGIALHVGGVVKDPDSLFYSRPQQLAELGVTTRMLHEVMQVDTEAKTLTVRSLETGEEFRDSYDKLIVTTGSWPVVPRMEGIGLDNIQLCKNYFHAKEIISRSKDARRVAVIGAGYIGIELAEAFRELGKEVVLLDNMDRVMAKYLDAEFTTLAEEELAGHGIRTALGEMVTGFEGEDGRVQRVMTAGGSYEADLVVLCIGFRPGTDLLKGQIDMLDNGAILVDDYMRTSNPDVLAAGDSCAVRYNPTGKQAYIPLATNAVRMGTLVGKNLLEPLVRYRGTQGTSGIKLFDLNIASTGMTEEAAKAAGIAASAVTVQEASRPEFMPDYEDVLLKLVYESESGRILGAQVMSKADLTQAANTLSVCIQNRMTAEDLAYADFFFQPHYNHPWNLLNKAGHAAERQRAGAAPKTAPETAPGEEVRNGGHQRKTA
ncbi:MULTISPECIES: FAD-dependent oxidoreductase [unclassified Paenibacillus]|uniref:FAD-dependent oxidoreductase n=1 Tax=unclassified Paenibacillus TaxID=185978 RepID=UPI000955D658|nr:MULTISPECIES: FAD-dependent oxidoreductase [unclassified Paenibacillus]ASS68671.1 FAD-dependent oxidoreductase [Paenibacillus sp. RUD330]SIR55441.1 NADPH-dependent 2,4-dienoyl-CoA reductase, sulfur reductase [Paenibacillus sp. RU4X]SIR63954.1 NADPH-dependent 2,4-dienoyl-CoA reductase, sulfur reductase [Paenibacillus sp. RU4T]